MKKSYILIIELNDEKNSIYSFFSSIDRQSAGVLLAQCCLLAGAETTVRLRQTSFALIPINDVSYGE